MIVGIDFGSTTTDVVLMNGKNVVDKFSEYSGKFSLKMIKRFLDKVKLIKVTGCGSLKLKSKIWGVAVKKVDEIKAIGIGGAFVSGRKNALVVSIGSGTCMVSVCDKVRHIGGSSIGGGTLEGLSKLLFGEADVRKIEAMAGKGKIGNVDLTMKEIYPNGVGILPASATASSFGSIKSADDNDKAAALINMIAQSIATLAVFAAKAHKHKAIVLTGKVATIKLVDKIIKKRITALSGLPVVIPKNAEYATAIGAVLG